VPAACTLQSVRTTFTIKSGSKPRICQPSRREFLAWAGSCATGALLGFRLDHALASRPASLPPFDAWIGLEPHGQVTVWVAKAEMGQGVLTAIPMLLAGPSELAPPPHIKEPLRLAISPLAVPALISPLAVAVLFSGSASVPSLTAALIFVGMVGAVLSIDLGLMLLSTYVAQYLTKPILEVFQKIFGFILLTFGIQLVLQALAKLGIMTATGF